MLIPSVQVTVVDAVTKTRICDATVTITGSDGYKETPAAWGDDVSCVYRNNREYADTYTIHVERATYVPAKTTGTATNNPDVCGAVTPAKMTIELAHP